MGGDVSYSAQYLCCIYMEQSFDKSISSEFGGGDGGNKSSERMPFWNHSGHRVVALIISARKFIFITIDLFRSYAYSMTKLALLAAYVSSPLLFFNPFHVSLWQENVHGNNDIIVSVLNVNKVYISVWGGDFETVAYQTTTFEKLVEAVKKIKKHK